MKLRLKPLKDQVIVITGASSGIGLATARMATRHGARLVLAARSDEDLEQLVAEIRSKGGDATFVHADVAVERDVRRIADEAVRIYGGFDTWINNAGVSVYGRAMEVSIDDMRRVFDTNVWGVILGSRVAVDHLRRRGGALVNIGSEVSDQAVPLQPIYSASKHAVKGWTDALRMELEDESAPVAVTLIKPGPIDTPYTQHAKNYPAGMPAQVPPVYTPESVAEAVLYSATKPIREMFVGSGAKFASTLKKVAPHGRPRATRDALYQPGGGLRDRGDSEGLARPSVYTKLTIHPRLAALFAISAGVLLTGVWRARALTAR
jgi:NAD(P)-dependent dehydrogenase (short-subunit alcohol dehydrogenase family)